MTLKEYLKSNKISREDFAKEIGASYGSVIKWTYGGRFPRPQTLQKIHELTNGKVTAYDFIQQVSK